MGKSDTGILIAMEDPEDLDAIDGVRKITNLNPEIVIKELLRVGKRAIVTIPNFGHWKVRIDLLIKGTMPVTNNLPNEWYNTPNLHMCTIQDFYNFCKKRNIKIFKSLSLNGEKISNPLI